MTQNSQIIRRQGERKREREKEARKILEDSYIHQSYPIIPSNPSNGITDFIRNDIREKTKRSIYDNMTPCERIKHGVSDWLNSTKPSRPFGEDVVVPSFNGLIQSGVNKIFPNSDDFIKGRAGNFTTSTLGGLNYLSKNYKVPIAYIVTRIGKHPVAQKWLTTQPLKILENATKGFVAVAPAIALSLDIGNVWTEDSGNTNAKRLSKTGIKGLSHMASYGVGVAATATSGLILKFGEGTPASVVIASAVWTLMVVGGNEAISWGENKAYEKFNIK